jgi:hypothetical protein
MSKKNILPFVSYGISTAILLLLAAGALAQAGETAKPVQHPWYYPLSTLMALILAGAVLGLFCYLFSIGFTAVAVRSGYPPNVARLGIWLGALLWGILFVFVLCVYIITYPMPLWFMIVLLLGLLFFGMVLLMTRRQISN